MKRFHENDVFLCNKRERDGNHIVFIARNSKVTSKIKVFTTLRRNETTVNLM